MSCFHSQDVRKFEKDTRELKTDNLLPDEGTIGATLVAAYQHIAYRLWRRGRAPSALERFRPGLPPPQSYKDFAIL